jgi:hypothetical protein
MRSHDDLRSGPLWVRLKVNGAQVSSGVKPAPAASPVNILRAAQNRSSN